MKKLIIISSLFILVACEQPRFDPSEYTVDNKWRKGKSYYLHISYDIGHYVAQETYQVDSATFKKFDIGMKFIPRKYAQED